MIMFFWVNIQQEGERRKYDVPRYTQVANAVPPLFAELVGLVLQEMLNNE